MVTAIGRLTTLGATTKTAYRACGLCEAACGVAIETEGRSISRVTGDKLDPISKGYICAKAIGLKEIHADPDRLTQPVVRKAGNWVETGWREALEFVGENLVRIRNQHGKNAIGSYIGNPTIHALDTFYLPALLRAIGSRQRFSAGTCDAMPRDLCTELMYGSEPPPIPDLDRTNFLIVIGANPAVSNGSVLQAPDIVSKLKSIRKRGGNIVVIDPRRTETADLADEYLAIRPGSDAYFLLAMVHTMLQEDIGDREHLRPFLNGLDQLESLVSNYAPEQVHARCGIEAGEIRRLARQFCNASKATIYGRLGTCAQEFGTLSTWAIDLINIVSGHFDRIGSTMFASPAVLPGSALSHHRRTFKLETGRWHSRVNGLPEVRGEYPSGELATEILTPGEGQIRALVVVAGNPVCTTPGAHRLVEALPALDFMVAIDPYINETNCFADVILPPPSDMERAKFELLLYRCAVRNNIRYSKPVFEKSEPTLHEWEIYLSIASLLNGQTLEDVPALEEKVIRFSIEEELGDQDGLWGDVPIEEVYEKLKLHHGPDRLLDLYIRSGMWGDGFGRRMEGLTLQKVKDATHGIDLGPLTPRLPGNLRTQSKKIELIPSTIVSDLTRLDRAFERPIPKLVLIGRRLRRSNNSWMHNLPSLNKGPEECILHIHPVDAAQANLSQVDRVTIQSEFGVLTVPFSVTDRVAPGTICLPHGWGHTGDTNLNHARTRPGVNFNFLTGDLMIDVPSGTAMLSGVPVSIRRSE